jgi:regulator of sirC expression with transglutaminase-like and TPR domain
MADWTLRDEWQLEAINVPRAALLIARDIAYPTLDIGHYLNHMVELADGAADHVPVGLPVVEQGERLADFLFGSLGYAGDRSNYYDPRNSYLNEVIERKLGLPIMLSVLYVDVATRLGIPAYGVSLPGHFIVSIRDGDEAHWLDPYHGGRWLTLNDCAKLIEAAIGYEGPLDAAWFLPADPRDIMVRMAHNLRGTYVRQQQWTEAAAAIRILRTIQPQSAEHLRDLGLVYYHQEALSQAAYFLNEYLAQSPNAADAPMIRQGMKDSLDDWVRLN